MILLSGFHNKYRFIWYSKFTGMKNMSEKDNFPFYKHKDLLDDLLQFTANYLYEKIKTKHPTGLKKAIRALVMEAFKDDKTMLCFNGYDSTTNLPYLFIEFSNNDIIREYIENAEIVRFVLDMSKKLKMVTIRCHTTVFEDYYTIRVRHKISFYNGGPDSDMAGVICPDSYVAYWNKELTHKLEEKNS